MHCKLKKKTKQHNYYVVFYEETMAFVFTVKNAVCQHVCRHVAINAVPTGITIAALWGKKQSRKKKLLWMILYLLLQFLITTGENLDYLDGVHTVFGEVTEGMDVLKTINETFVDKDFIPYQDIRCDCI